MPELSVVIPTYRRPAELARCLQALARQTAAAERFEVIVVDNDAAAPDRPDGPAVRHLREPVKGASAARNTGWRAARAPVILFLGDDILAEPGLVDMHLAFHAREPGETAGLLGHVRWADELGRTAFMRWLEAGYQTDYGRLDAGGEPSWGDFTTTQVSVKRSLLERAGGFDQARFPFLYEDTDLGYRLHRLGLRLHYEPRARAEHLHRPTPAQWRERMAVVAAAERRFAELHGEPPWFAERMREAIGAPPPRPRLARALRPLGRAGWRRAAVWADHQLDLHHRRLLAPAFLAAWDAASGGEAVDHPGGRADGEAVRREVARDD
jgi:GT2 family glycosyltransferase